MARARRYWLMKSEPNTYSIDDLRRDGTTPWEGVRNYTARNTMRDDMAIGDLALFYHSSAKPSGVAGVCEVCTASYPDPTQFDSKSPYYDAAAREDEPRWMLVDVAFVEAFEAVVSLADLKARADSLEGLMVIQKGIRFSVQPVSKSHFKAILKLAKAKTRVR